MVVLWRRDVTASENGIGMKTGKAGQTEITRVTEPVTPTKPRTIPALRHAPMSSAFPHGEARLNWLGLRSLSISPYSQLDSKASLLD
jgi:hypothetical protein